MTPPIRPDWMPESLEDRRRARVRRNLDRLKAANAPQADVDAYVASERVTPQQELAATPLTGRERIANGVRAGYQGLSFNFGDELMGGVRGALDPELSVSDAIGEEREALNRFRDEHPKAALAAELGGGLVSGGAVAKGAVAGMRGARAAARLLATGAGGGAVGGAGAGEGVAGTMGGAAVGAAGGAVLGRVAGSVATSRIGDTAVDIARRLSSGMRAARGGAAEAVEQLGARLGASGGDAAAAAGGAGGGAPPPFTISGIAREEHRRFGTPALRAAGRALAPDGDLAPRFTALDGLERNGMGDEALLMNAGDDRTVRAVRAAVNQPDSPAGQLVGERLARQGGQLGEAVPRDIRVATGFAGDEPGAVALNRMLREARDKARPLYEAARKQGDVFPERTPRVTALRIAEDLRANGGVSRRAAVDAVGGDAAVDAVPIDRLLEAPIVRAAIQQAKSLPEFANLPDTDIRVLDKVYKNIGGRVRAARRAGDDELARDMGVVMQDLRAELFPRSPAYRDAVKTFADEAGPREAFEQGLRSRTAAPGELTVALGGDDALSAQARRAGFSTSLQEAAKARASNADFDDMAQFRDVARAVVGTPADRERFIEAFGEEQYQVMRDRLMPKIRAAAQNAAARGNSTTTKQLLDALAFGDEATMDLLQNIAGGRPAVGATNWVTGKLLGPLDRARRLGIGKVAGETADILTTRGTGESRTVLAMVKQVMEEDARRRAAQATSTGVKGAVLRSAQSRAP